MSVVTVTKANVRQMGPAHGSIVNPYEAGEALSNGDVVFIHTDGKVKIADGNVDVATARGVGIVCNTPMSSAGDAAAGDMVSVCEFGPVVGFSGATVGSLGYLSNTVGKIDTAAGAFARILGRFQAADTFFVQPVLTDAASA